MEVSFKQILESADYQDQKARVNNSQNWGNVSGNYLTDYSTFKKTVEEKVKLANLKAQWRKSIQAMGYTKRNVPNNYTTISN